MMISEELKVTTEVLWRGAAIFAVIDLIYVLILKSKVKPDMFARSKLRLTIISGIFWFLLLAFIMSGLFWQSVYHYLFPSWSRWFIPPVYGFLFAAMSLLFWRISIALPGNPAVYWCLLGGLWGMITHIWGIYRGLLDKPPMLQGASPVATAIMPLFEFFFYYCLILTFALLLHRFRRK